MEVNRINYNTSFKSNMPIYKVLKRGLDGVESELKSFAQVRGPVQALVNRLNNEPNARETLFFKKHIKAFAQTPEVTTTIAGHNSFAKKHIIFGDDVAEAARLRRECFRNSRMTEPEIRDYIVRSIIEPIANKIKAFRFKGDKVGEQVGLVMHVAQNSKSKYDIALEVTSFDGNRIYAKLPFENAQKPKIIQPTLPVKETPVAAQAKPVKLVQEDLPGLNIPEAKHDDSWPWPKYFDHCITPFSKIPRIKRSK